VIVKAAVNVSGELLSIIRSAALLCLWRGESKKQKSLSSNRKWIRGDQIQMGCQREDMND